MSSISTEIIILLSQKNQPPTSNPQNSYDLREKCGNIKNNNNKNKTNNSFISTVTEQLNHFIKANYSFSIFVKLPRTVKGDIFLATITHI